MFQVVLSLSYGSAVSAFVSGHNLSHHRHTQSPRDVMRTTKVRHRSNLLEHSRVRGRASASPSRRTIVLFARHAAGGTPPGSGNTIENFAVLGRDGVLLFLLDWRKGLVYWLVPHLYAAWGIISMNYLQHDGCDIEHPYNHSRNFVGKFVNWWTFNNGYHGIHHDHPACIGACCQQCTRRQIAPYIAPELDRNRCSSTS